MVTLRIICPKCRTSYKTDGAHAGRKARCKKCDAVFRIPPLDDPAPSCARKEPLPPKDEQDRKNGMVRASRSLAQEVRSLGGSAFDKPGPLFNEQRRLILEQWFSNFAANLDAVGNAMKTGRDMGNNAISPPEIAEGLDRMCSEYGKMFQRLEDVCGNKVRTRFQTVLERAASLSSDLTKPPVCMKCNREFPWHQGNPQELTRVEQLICAKEDLQFALMKKITCPYCSTQALMPRKTSSLL